MRFEKCKRFTGERKKAVVIKRKDLNLANKPADAIFRQTLNVKTQTWWCPKIRTSNGKWRTIKHRELVCSPQLFGENIYKFSLWKIREYMDSLYYAEDMKIWRCGDIYKVRVYPYSYFFLKCERIFHSIHGIT